MTIDTSSLRKVLELEQKKGFSDTAVFGGLDRFLRNWATRASATVADDRVRAHLKAVGNTGYGKMTVAQRQDWLKDVLALAGELESGIKRDPVKAKSRPAPVKPALRIRKPAAGAGKSLDQSVTVIKGMGASIAGKFNKLGVKTVRDLLYFFPHRHVDYSQLKTVSQLTEGTEETVIVNVWEAQEKYLGRGKGTEATVGDATGNARAVWFNNPYVAKALRTNTRIVISGRVKMFHGHPVFESPEWEPAEEAADLIHTGRLVPIYPLTEGLYQRPVRRLVKSTVNQWVGAVPEFLPPVIKKSRNLLDLPEAIAQAHYPDDTTAYDRARTRLAFDELFLLQLGVLSRKRAWRESQPGNVIKTDKKVLEQFLKSLPFTLTAAQQKVLNEILTDMEKPQAMSRLLQGEVGSGKTVVATAAVLMAVAQGYQAAFMAPTEILAEQHIKTVQNLLARAGQAESENSHLYTYAGVTPGPVSVAMLIGALPLKKKRELHKLIIDGKVNIVIGTHALIQEEVEFKKLGFIVVDEQHRFGVEQRGTLRQKGTNPHVLVMTATPIPRTLALTLYGDLDLSVINELPPGRQLIKTKWLKPDERDKAYNFIRREVAAGHQAFIICPLIEESEVVQARAAVVEYEHLVNEVFTDLKLGLLHGKMSSADKERAMQDFHECKTHILVSTPVVEVGIDVPNATVMMVESADRFGLAQLHQFRGRVGRGPAQSYCILLAENPSAVGQERLSIIETIFDGFKLAEEDLKMRGPGEFFGTRQSGLPDLKMAKLGDVGILEMARAEAEKLFERDPHLKDPAHAPLVKELARVWTEEAGEWS
ncbi:MAG: ATP-dependent DNA helicase RecG [Dehalococcoidia bacterium]|nr:ATP-dependent DNA helicase RecG [Dehalococcoidia bacterium]